MTKEEVKKIFYSPGDTDDNGNPKPSDKGMHHFVGAKFDPAKVTDPYLREVIIKTRAYFQEGKKRVDAHLTPKKKGVTHS